MQYELRETLLSARGIHASLGGKPILAGVDLEVRNVVRPDIAQGQVVGILGRSGIGKTTLFRILAGLQPPDRGRVLVTEHQLHVCAGMVGVVHQEHPLFEHRTVRGNIAVAARAGELDQGLALLARVGLGDRLDAWPCELSGGERQRVAIVQQIVRGHRLLLLDEPFSALDPGARARTCELVAELSHLDERNTIIVVTHDIREAVRIADTLHVLGPRTDAPGARIVASHDLIARGLAWQPEIHHTAAFADCVRELEASLT